MVRAIDWLKNKEELLQFLSDMKDCGDTANLENYIEWIQYRNKNTRESATTNESPISFKLKNYEFTGINHLRLK